MTTMTVEFDHEGHKYVAEGTYFPGSYDTRDQPGDPAEFSVDACTYDGVPMTEDEIETATDDEGWYSALMTKAEDGMDDGYYEFDGPDTDPMDGDHETALASAGFGTDEDYGGCLGDEYEACFYEGE